MHSIILGGACALLVGLSLGLCGAGGSIFAVPILVYIMGIAPNDATVGSLMMVGITAAFAAWHAHREGHINLTVAMQFVIPSLISIYASRMWLLPKIPDILYQSSSMIIQRDHIIMLCFSSIMLMSARAMLRPRIPQTHPLSAAALRLRITIQGLILGGLMGFVGAGGGFIIVPVLIGLLGFNMLQAVGTSLSIISINSLIAFVVGIQSGSHIDYPIIITLTALALLGSWIGKRIATHLNEVTLKQGFAFMVFIVGISMLAQNLWSIKI